jgi:hypothetical protein
MLTHSLDDHANVIAFVRQIATTNDVLDVNTMNRTLMRGHYRGASEAAPLHEVLQEGL